MFPKSLSFSPILVWASNTLKYIHLKYNLTVADFFQLVILSLFSISKNNTNISPVSKNKKLQSSSKSLLLSFYINISKRLTASVPITICFSPSDFLLSFFFALDPCIFSTDLFHFFLIDFPATRHTFAQLHMFYSHHFHLLKLRI